MNWYREFKEKEKQGVEVKWRFYPNTCPCCGKWSMAFLKPVDVIESENSDVVCYDCLEGEND